MRDYNSPEWRDEMIQDQGLADTNTWPGGTRHALDQGDHEAWNATHYPGTRQICVECDEPTTFCEEDGLWLDDGTGPFCSPCYDKKGTGECLQA
jgi:hypothetical protein